MLKKHVNEIINEKYNFYLLDVRNLLCSLEGDNCLSGDESPLKNVWEEWKFQNQIEESNYYEIYEETIRGVIFERLEKLLYTELKLLWLLTEAYFEFEEEEGYPNKTRLINDIVDELLPKLNDIASTEEINPIKWFEFESSETTLKEIEVIENLNKYVQFLESFGLDATDYIPKQVIIIGYNSCIIPKYIDIGEIVSGSNGSDWLSYSKDSAENMVEELIMNLDKLIADEEWFKDMFKYKLSKLNGYTLNELLTNDDPIEKLLITYQVIFDIYFNDRKCDAIIAF